MSGKFFEDLAIGDSAELVSTVTEQTIQKFAEVSGDDNPIHLDAAYAATTQFGERIAHGMLSASFISAVIGTRLPGPGCIYLSQSLRFKRPVKIGDVVTATATITALDADKGRATFETVCAVAGKTVIEGEALVMVPRKAG
jgi:3-hydroxybutyryl-CoA dehydratase